MRPVEKLRFGVHREGLGYSVIWLAFSQRDEFYLGVRSLVGRTMKVSFHGSGVSHVKLARGSRIETPVRWRRATTPASGLACAATVNFPADLTRSFNDAKRSARKPLIVVEAAPPGRSVQFLFLYSRDAPEVVGPIIAKEHTDLLVSTHLNSGEFVYVGAREMDWDPERTREFVNRKLPALALEPDYADRQQIENFSAVLISDVRDEQPLHLTNVQGFTLSRS